MTIFVIAKDGTKLMPPFKILVQSRTWLTPSRYLNNKLFSYLDSRTKCGGPHRQCYIRFIV